MTKALIPAAGLGTRWYPIARVIPKQMVPINCKPVIHYVVEEVLQAGINRVGVIIRAGRELIREYLSQEFDADITYIYQSQPRGLGDAILQAEAFVNDEPFLVLLPDDLYLDLNPTELLLACFQKLQASVFCLADIPPHRRQFHSRIKGEQISEELFRITGFYHWRETLLGLESDMPRGLGRYVFTPTVFRFQYEVEKEELSDRHLIHMECLEASCWANRLQKVASAFRAPPADAVARLL